MIRVLLSCLILLPCLVAGCNREPPLPPLTPVKGKVLVGEELLSGGNVTFVPTTIDEKSKVPASTGALDANGNYELVTGGQKGAPAGKYKVVVSPNMMPTAGSKGMPTMPFNAKYRDQKTTPLEIEVPNSNGYDLKLTK